MSGPLGSSQWMYSSGGFYPTVIDQSLMFDGTSYLSRTPSVAGDLKTWTFSGWVKRGNFDTEQPIFAARPNSTYPFSSISFTTANAIKLRVANGGSINVNLVTNALFRDPSAWYHVCAVWDTTEAVTADRYLVYVNGVLQVTSGTLTLPINSDSPINDDNRNFIGVQGTSGGGIDTDYFDGYLADTYFVDGTALDPTSFGEFKSGVWIPKAYTGSYGTNGFHLTYQDDTVSEGFNTVTYTGNGAKQSISGIGFSPDFVWTKIRSSTNNHYLLDQVRGGFNRLNSNTTNMEATSSNAISSFDSDGYTIAGAQNEMNANGSTYVAWCWDAGGSTVSNTAGTIPSSVRANPAYGFSIVSYTGNTTDGATVGHGLGVAPNMFIVKDRDSDIRNWKVYHSSLGETLALDLNEPNSESAGPWSNTAPTSTVFTLGGGVAVNNTNDYIAYCFADIAGYSKFGSYTGTSASGNVVTTGFKPAFVMIKCSSTSGATDNWLMYDNTRDTPILKSKQLIANDGAGEGIFDTLTFTDTGFTLETTNAARNATGETYIYMAFADTRDLAFWRDQSGNGNDWQPNNLNYQDTVFDSPTNNYATLNPLATSVTLSEGNLKASGGATHNAAKSTMAISTGMKVYVEVTFGAAPNGGWFGLTPRGDNETSYTATDRTGLYSTTGSSTFYGSGAGTNVGGPLLNNSDTWGMAVDFDNGRAYFCKITAGTPTWYARNGSNGSQYAPDGASDNLFEFMNSDTTLPLFVLVAQASTPTLNFGQTGYQNNSVPDGFLALSTANLPEPSISPLYGASPQDHFNTVLYTGNSTDRNISVGFQPDFTWIKRRSTSKFHALMDSVRGFAVAGETPYMLVSNDTGGESSDQTNSFEAFTSDGFSLGTDGSGQRVNLASETYVAWNWKASNATAVSNTAGTIPSQVSANTTAGFSIVSYTGNTPVANATVGHGLDFVPDMIIVKNRDRASGWLIYHSANTSAPETDFLQFTAAGTTDNNTVWNDTAPTTSVFSIGTTSSVNFSGENFIAYCFHSVEGYSKFGSYTGNLSTDGPFVYTGFRPAFVMVKRYDPTGGNWWINDSKRDPENADPHLYLYPNLPLEEGSSTSNDYDFLSNGFKLRNTTVNNASGGTYIYMAFAENPFKYANAR
jgi:hypothetical protein